MPNMRVIGVPRSGTNLFKFLVESHTGINCHFSIGWWKHGIISPIIVNREAQADTFPTVIMFRDPLFQLISFYKFAQKGRRAMSGADGFENFVSSPIRMSHQGLMIEYMYSSPVEYLMQFYYAAVNWKIANKYFVKIEDLNNDPSIVKQVIAKAYPGISLDFTPALPDRYLGRNVDRHVSEGWEYESDTSVDEEERQAMEIRSGLSGAQITGMLRPELTALFDEMARERVRAS
jgi:hypothetical protein